MDRSKDPVTGAAEPFLARWSRRKHEARDKEVSGPEAGSARERSTADLPPEPPSRVLTDADMPPVESLRYDDDWSGFLSPGVSDGLRQEALRRLFSSPELNVTDGLDSYSGDYTSFEALGDTVTADMRHHLERLSEPPRSGEAADPAPPATAGPGDLEPAASGEDPSRAPAGEVAEGDQRRPVSSPIPSSEPPRCRERNDINDLELNSRPSAK
jgi:hypothetical protein